MKSFSQSTVQRFMVRIALAAAISGLMLHGALATHGPDVETTVGSNDNVFSQNKQNEPTVAINPTNPMQLTAGANDNIDLEACNVGPDNTCPFTPGVGVSGFQASVDGGALWVQPTYTGYSARHCLGMVGTPPGDTCTPNPAGSIGTAPWYFEEGLTANGDPVQVFGPRPGAGGTFSWANGARLYYESLTVNFPAPRDEQTFRGQAAITVARTDDIAGAVAGNKSAWMRPVIISHRLSATTFSDKNWIAADDAASSPFFGNVYACWTSFRSAGGAPEPILVTHSKDGGDTWEPPRQLTRAANPPVGLGRQGCQLDTDSDGVAYVFFAAGESGRPEDPPLRGDQIFMSRSFDGGERWERPRPVADVQFCGQFDRAQNRLTFDGIAGARTNSFPSVSIANGAPAGNGPDTIFLTWCDGPTPTTMGGAAEQAMVRWSTDKGETWQGPVNAALPGDRPDFPAIALSPDGTDAYLVYMAFHAPWQATTADPRMFEGVVLHANVNPMTGQPGVFTQIHRGLPGDARGSSANGLFAEFLGDYNDIRATNDFAYAVWNDARNASDCGPIDTWRQARVAFILGQGADPGPPPPPQIACAPTFGNTDIFGTKVLDPTP